MKTPNKPQPPCNGLASNGSSISYEIRTLQKVSKTIPEITPTAKATVGDILLQLPVTPTKPAKSPHNSRNKVS